MSSQEKDPTGHATSDSSDLTYPTDPSDQTNQILPLAWTVHLYSQDPTKRISIFLFAAISALAGLLIFHNLIFAVIAVVAILASTAEFWLPLHYKLDEKGASVRCAFSVTAIEWSQVRRIVLAEEGWKLSPHRSEGRTSPFRGVYLRFAEEPETIQEYVRCHVGGDARFVEQGTDPGGGRGPSSEGGEGDQEAEDGGARDLGAGGS